MRPTSGSATTTIRSRLKRYGLPTHRRPPTPGEVLSEEFIKPMGLRQDEFAEKVGTTYQSINRIVNGRQAITPEMALKLAAALGTTPQLWMGLQTDLDIWDELQEGEVH